MIALESLVNEVIDSIEWYWGLILVIGVALVAYLKWYDDLRNKGRSILCDVLILVGNEGAFKMCQSVPADDKRRRRLMQSLRKQKDMLNPERLKQLQTLELDFKNRAFNKLVAAASIIDGPLDHRAEDDKRKAVHQIIENGNEDELLAMESIAEGDIESGLRLLVNNAAQATQENTKQWRRIGRIVFGVDMARALSAYKKVVVLDQSDPWDAIYLGRIYTRVGNLSKALSTYNDALSLLPLTEERTRSALYNEIGNVQVKLGDLPAALKSYRGAIENTTQLRRIGKSAFGVDTARALGAYEKIIALDRSNPWDAIYLGRLYTRAGNLNKALSTFRVALSLLPQTEERDRLVLNNEIGNVQVNQGDLPAARKSYRAAMEIGKHLASSDSANTAWQHDLSISHNKLGDVQVTQGDIPSGLESYRAAMEISKHLASSDPSNTEWQRDLSVSHNKLGNVQVKQGDLSAALESYHIDMEISERLVRSDPANTEWQRDLSISHNKLGDVQVVRGDLPAALESYRAAMEIGERLVSSDPANTEWQRDLSVSHNKLGNVQVKQSDLPAALESYCAAMEIGKRLASSDPANTEWQRDLSVSHNKLGNVQVARNDLPAAFESYRAAMEIRKRLAKSDPANVDWQADLAVSYGKLGQPMVHMHKLDKALVLFRMGRAIIAPLVKQSEDVQWKQYLNFFDTEIAALED